MTTLPPGTPRQSDWAAPISVEISNLGPGESPTVELVYETAEIAEWMGRALDLALEDDAIALFEAVAPRGWLRRRKQRAARRVRMARKKRRGYD